ncbi:hypothetical protein ILUMI_16730 [Ignelater luminosus]|uniref:Uncharacterized protein n=1 Tax=Ignelater luminosus TaxID=2038154 RepID=A0A8K0CRR8_IGNLU|nr:hypothetical protein ILUMI_16730 [Ignelater luminosus]
MSRLPSNCKRPKKEKRGKRRDSVEDYGMEKRQDEMQKEMENISSDDSDIICSDPPWKAISNPKIQIEDDLSEMVPSTLANLHTRSIKLPTLAEALTLSNVDVRKLSTDQTYLYEMCEGVESSGNISIEFSDFTLLLLNHRDRM